MALTEDQKRWNQKIEESYKNKDKKWVTPNLITTSNLTVRELYEELAAKIIEVTLDKTEIIEKSNYLSFKIKGTNKNFVDIQIQKASIKCVVNLRKGAIKDKLEKLRDISKLGHFGVGDYEMTIKSVADIQSSLKFIKQSYDKNFK